MTKGGSFSILATSDASPHRGPLAALFEALLALIRSLIAQAEARAMAQPDRGEAVPGDQPAEHTTRCDDRITRFAGRSTGLDDTRDREAGTQAPLVAAGPGGAGGGHEGFAGEASRPSADGVDAIRHDRGISAGPDREAGAREYWTGVDAPPDNTRTALRPERRSG